MGEDCCVYVCERGREEAETKAKPCDIAGRATTVRRERRLNRTREMKARNGNGFE